MNPISKIAITMGDPGGIGPEIIIKSLSQSDIKKHQSTAWIVLGSKKIFSELDPEFFKKFKSVENIAAVDCGGFYFFDVTPRVNTAFAPGSNISGHPCEPVSGKVHEVNAAFAFAALRLAADWAVSELIDGVVTAPLNKTAMRLIDPGFIGHTEFFAAAAKVSKYAMCFISPRLKVTLATIHVPLKDVSAGLTTDLIYDKIILTHTALKKYCGLTDPNIAVCALNPHGKETGPEEDAVIVPAVLKAAQQGLRVCGPFSADQLFYEAYQEQRYDALISMYHDQALGPFKMIAFHEGVNVTLGLPFIRTSPDHGTAFDIAYKNQADHRSMLAAMVLAAQYAGNTIKPGCNQIQ